MRRNMIAVALSVVVLFGLWAVLRQVGYQWEQESTAVVIFDAFYPDATIHDVDYIGDGGVRVSFWQKDRPDMYVYVYPNRGKKLDGPYIVQGRYPD